MRSHILASVPQHVGYPSNAARPGPWSQFDSSVSYDIAPPDHTSLSLPLVRLSGGYALLWGLYLAGSLDISMEPVRARVVSMLRTMGKTMGVQQAFVLAERLEGMQASERSHV